MVQNNYENRIFVIETYTGIRNQLDGLNNFCERSLEIISVNIDEIIHKSIELLPDFILIESFALEKYGYENLVAFKQSPKTLNIPVILITEDFQQDSVQKFLDIGISDFISKPINIQELSLRIKNIRRKNQFFIKTNPDELFSNLSLMSKSIANAVVIFYPGGEIEWVNAGFENIYGYKLPEYLTKYDHEIYSPDSRYLKNALKRFETENTSISFEHEIYPANSSNKWIQTTLTPIYNELNQLSKIIAVESDVTALHKEKQRADELLLNILPFEIAEQLKKKGRAKSRKYKTVTVFFADFKNFTGLTRTVSTKELINELNLYIKKFDEIIEKHFIEKIKTIGDAYMCAGGLPLKNRSNPFDVVLAGLEIQKYIRDVARDKEKNGEYPWKLRAGIHTGEVIAGVIGNKKFAYDIWGDTVNTASRMEENSEEGKVNVSGVTYEFIKDYFDCTYRGNIKVKNITEEMDMYFVNGLKPKYAEDAEGIFPNEEFRKILAKY